MYAAPSRVTSYGEGSTSSMDALARAVLPRCSDWMRTASAVCRRRSSVISACFFARAWSLFAFFFALRSSSFFALFFSLFAQALASGRQSLVRRKW